MISSILLLSLSLASARDATEKSARSSVTVFREACLEGTARFKRSEARRIAGSDLPTAIRNHLYYLHSSSNLPGEFYELTLPEGSAFLVVQTTRGRAEQQDRYCSIFSKHLKYWDARVAVEQTPSNLVGIDPAQRNKMIRMGYHRTISSLGYQITVNRIDGGFVAMTSILPDWLKGRASNPQDQR